MKTKFFKSVLPALAILLAISLSFATVADHLSQVAYYDDPFIPGIQEVPGGSDCLIDGSEDCTYDGKKVYADQALTIELFERD